MRGGVNDAKLNAGLRLTIALQGMAEDSAYQSWSAGGIKHGLRLFHSQFIYHLFFRSLCRASGYGKTK